MHLYERLAELVREWRANGYPQSDYPVVGEILDWAANPHGAGFRLRAPQLRALETYWYLRLVQSTPHILELYSSFYSKPSERMDALGLVHEDLRRIAFDEGIDTLLECIRSDEDFVKRYRLQALNETLTLDYPSYIFALAMGAGKTKLIGAIFATEFAMSIEYPQGPFVQNALVFAPGKTIIEALRELADMEYDRILPPRLYKEFAASVKITFTRDGEKQLPVIPGSFFNVIVTNTEKIRIQKENIRKSDLGPLFTAAQADEARAEVANARLQAIANLPHLAIFSDEAHHTYGNSLDRGLKKVRQTVDYLAANTNLVCVVNTTGTPYTQRQPLKDVVIWYGLSEGIRDGILKEVADNIRAYSFDGNEAAYAAHVVEDFFQDYGDVALPDGTPAKLAMYFPQTDDVADLRPAIEAKLLALGLPTTLILEHHTNAENKEEFDRFWSSDKRIALLVNQGTEGWNVPALFACALVRKLRTSNNFVLQAASRCLRQVPGNSARARIYLSVDNQGILDRQLQETYGETIADLNQAESLSRKATIRVRKLNIPPLVVQQLVRRVERRARPQSVPLALTRPAARSGQALTETRLTIAEQRAGAHLLQQMEDTQEIPTRPDTLDLYAAAVELAANYHLDIWEVYEQLLVVGEGQREIPTAFLDDLADQIEEQTRDYEVVEEIQERALALLRLEGFDREIDPTGTEVYTAEISYPLSKERLLVSWADMQQDANGFGFHYTPYSFDSNPELSFLEILLKTIHQSPDDVEDIYFTGALTDPAKTEFLISYLGEDRKHHYYAPDFIIRRKDGRCLIVEIKDARFEAATREDQARGAAGQAAVTTEGRKAIAAQRWVDLNPDRLQYQIIFAPDSTLTYEQIELARKFVAEE